MPDAFRGTLAGSGTRARHRARPWRAILAALAALLAAGGGLAAYAVLIEPDRLVVRERTIATGKWPADLPPLRIAAIGDLHMGALHIDDAKIAEVVDRINAARPDVVLLLGDFVIRGAALGRHRPPEEVARHLARLVAPLGVYAVLGNHDWYEGGRRVWRALESAGIQVLENAAAPLPGGRIWIAGIADDTTRTPDPAAATAAVPADAVIVAMAHDPAVFPDIPPRVALTLSGHTHAGQVRLPLIGPLVNASRAPLSHSYGHIREDGADLFVTAGIGTSIAPIRFNAPPEIVLIQLQREAAPP